MGVSDLGIKVGDRVRIKDGCGPIRSKTGTVREVHACDGVAWGYAVDVDDDPVPDGAPWEMGADEVEGAES